MEDRTKTIAAIAILIGIAALILIIIGVVVTGKKVVSPLPTEGAIKIIFISPTP
jgi:glucose uptake protein GlcU